ncbi:hypothetical protein [Stenotrophomonas oahuensis]|uniref:Uncharacterized protein n=1 Tax=Stenotrophomonas oahuensis TaxID=3003271 RepID=A0ABY9YNE4_9GAMM|nr:hypothetical protein [Stenotrophomonas sp. A5586]WNH52412.1 hypothetical protein PDM29_19145 [Stenotrophomonas sp. A5586]
MTYAVTYTTRAGKPNTCHVAASTEEDARRAIRWSEPGAIVTRVEPLK